ncbi:MAG: asparagine synthase (glutamine-hydrolyzing) [Chloroflexi bacterium]|jgi:asparagine synthase (glutamine-hydrolysing)|nr:asparagine synthase (glutamine-hydrolyzing) [Chloroflexota bacterium]
MCGITGFWDRTNSTAQAELENSVQQMTAKIYHRGPDAGGAWCRAQDGIALGFRRLAILDLSPMGHQPMHSASGRYVIVYNGEVYNFAEMRTELDACGASFRGTSDTEVMLAAIEAWGLETALQRFNGMFAIALWDRAEKRLTLARDRMGIKPLYYGWFGNTLLFGSELKALRAHPSFREEINRDALALYLRHNYVPAPFSIYQGIFKLPAGSYLTLQHASSPREFEPQPYWQIRQVVEDGLANPFEGSEQEALDALDAMLRRSVGLRMVADVPLGAFLSGGIDSSTIVALMQSQSSIPVKTFTIGFHEQGFDEARYARQVAAHLGTEHTELYVTPEETRQVIPLLPALYDEPFADSSQIPTYLVSKLARQHVTVSLSGDGGDELFGGYNRYFMTNAIWRRIGWLPFSVRRLLSRAMLSVPTTAWYGIFRMFGHMMGEFENLPNPADKAQKLAEVISIPNQEAVYLDLVSHWKKPTDIVIGAQEPATLLRNRSAWAKVPTFTEQMMYLDMMTYLPDDILVKVDRASMGVSLEARAPFLDDHEVIEFVAGLPLGMKVRGNEGKWILRQLLYRYVPRTMLERPKMGFGVPIDQWLRGPLRGWAEDYLSEERLRRDGYLNPAPIRQKWQEHLAGQRNWQYYLWDILMFQAWLD